MSNKFYKLLGAIALLATASIVNAQDVPIELGDGGSVDYYQNRGSVGQLYNQNLLTQDAINRMLAFGMELDMEVDITFARLGNVISEQIAQGNSTFDPSYPEHGDTRTSRGQRQEGPLNYEYIFTDVYLVTPSGGGWFEMERSKKITELPPPAESEVDDGGN